MCMHDQATIRAYFGPKQHLASCSGIKSGHIVLDLLVAKWICSQTHLSIAQSNMASAY